ncbi:hypothetical protein BOTBODRAFT_29612 [Botryobasidium botryosum FD-172 SS1]|uniref:Diaminopimelate epimerase-like protein n=1 Tax=Botryobasidium botryosum (strain FD-172 SS1) TaxID=930990 RepID=A0A067MU93_BOTB1|nr:hypothetical protein BOTBODRAFT_29612 [Botryobasidium botryosum FD-172 SS1]
MTPLTLNYTIVDAFTTKPFNGNPASVIILPLDSDLSDPTLQNIALEFSLSETAFITQPESQESHDTPTRTFGLRWFTPKIEVALCGHATLASAKVLFSTPSLVPAHVNLIRFSTLSGVLTAARLPPVDGADSKIELDFPSGEVHAVEPEFFEKVESVVARAFNSSTPSVVKFAGGGEGISFKPHLLIEVDGEKLPLEGASVNPNIFPVDKAELAPYRAIGVTSQSNKPGISFVSRVFCPLSGIPEDPVTGSAHSLLGPYWRVRLPNVQAGQEMNARQVGGRVGEIGVVWDEQTRRCRIRGSARVTAKGEFYL